jgi:biopolymer transport protein TolR
MKQTLFTQTQQSPFIEINLTPLIDTTLTILILFIIIAPIIEQGLEINLPAASSSKITSKSTHTVITINKNKQIFIDATLIPEKKLGSHLELLARSSASVVIKADKRLPFQTVIQVLDTVRSSGITNISIATEPLRK